MTLPISITPTSLKIPVTAKVVIPGSKSYTNRSLILAALTKGRVILKNVLRSDDTEAMINCLKVLGIKIEIQGHQLVVHDDITAIHDKTYQLYVHESGTTARFILALACVVPGVKIIQGSARLNERPISDLVDALRCLGANIQYCEKEGQFPIKVLSSSLTNNTVHLKSDVSSQFCSALLLISPYISNGLTIHLHGQLISKPYVHMTVACMQEWGVTAIQNGDSYCIRPHQNYQKEECVIEGDFSSAAYFFAIAALTKSTITVDNLNPTSLQADRKFLEILTHMGNEISYKQNSVTVTGKQVVALTVDMEDCPDQVMTLAVMAAFAPGITKITGVRSLRYKETERVLAMKNELAKMGIQTEDTDNAFTIFGGAPQGATINTYNDHRIAMAFACAGTCLDNVTVHHPEVVNKTFPNFWQTLQSLS